MKSKLDTRMAVIVSAAVLVAALFVILRDDYSEEASKWAYGMAGVIVGYWLR